MSKIDEIGVEYANEHGGGLPLTAKEFCNALALWVEKQLQGAGIEITPRTIAGLMESTDTVTINLDDKIKFNLNAELVADIASSLRFPVSNPTEGVEIVGVDTSGQQVMIPQNQVCKMYKHFVTFSPTVDNYQDNDQAIVFTFYSNSSTPTTVANFINVDFFNKEIRGVFAYVLKYSTTTGFSSPTLSASGFISSFEYQPSANRTVVRLNPSQQGSSWSSYIPTWAVITDIVTEV